MVRSKTILLLSFAFLFSFGDSALARRYDRERLGFEKLYAKKTLRNNFIGSSQAKQIAEQKYGGEALSATFVDAGDLSAYRVKLIKAGRVKIVTIPAQR
jgi:uncharacterized membrane protein YkoI